MFIKGNEGIIGMKQQFVYQLSDGKLKDYIIEKEQWSQYTFDIVAWRDYEIAYKRLSKRISVKHALIFGTQEGKMGGIVVGRNHVAFVTH
jgi:hypothetical protein